MSLSGDSPDVQLGCSQVLIWFRGQRKVHSKTTYGQKNTGRHILQNACENFAKFTT